MAEEKKGKKVLEYKRMDSSAAELEDGASRGVGGGGWIACEVKKLHTLVEAWLPLSR